MILFYTCKIINMCVWIKVLETQLIEKVKEGFVFIILLYWWIISYNQSHDWKG